MARYDRRPVQRLRFAVESTFGSDLTGDVATNFKDLRHMPTAIMRGTMVEADNTVRQNFFDQRNRVLGPDRGSVAVETYFCPSDEAITSAVSSPTKTPQSTLHEAPTSSQPTHVPPPQSTSVSWPFLCPS